jgi:hypothetical protein
LWIVAALAVVTNGCSSAPLTSGTGGSPGFGGIPATGGNVGTGGNGAGGASSALCDQLRLEYLLALPTALACTPGAPAQCQMIAALDLSQSACPVCGNEEYVNDPTPLEMLETQWLNTCQPSALSQGCGLGPCTPPTLHASCWPTSPGASTGTCVPYGPDAGTEYVPDGGESCDQLAADWTTAALAARACTPGAPNQCQQVVATGPGSRTRCDCPTSWYYVNDKTVLDDPVKKWDLQCSPICAGQLCGYPNPPTGVCVPVDGGASGICMPQTPDAGH